MGRDETRIEKLVHQDKDGKEFRSSSTLWGLFVVIAAQEEEEEQHQKQEEGTPNFFFSPFFFSVDLSTVLCDIMELGNREKGGQGGRERERERQASLYLFHNRRWDNKREVKEVWGGGRKGPAAGAGFLSSLGSGPA